LKAAQQFRHSRKKQAVVRSQQECPTYLSSSKISSSYKKYEPDWMFFRDREIYFNLDWVFELHLINVCLGNY
jgi:hypothetical protein